MKLLDHESASLPENPPIRFKKLLTLGADQRAPGFGFTDLAFSPDGKILTASRWRNYHESDVTLWDMEKRKFLRVFDTPPGSGHDVSAIAFVPPGDRLVTGCSGRNRVLLWDVRTGQLIDTLDLGRIVIFGVTGLAAFPDGKRVICCMGAGLAVWDLEAKTHTFLPLDEHLPRHPGFDDPLPRSCESVAFTADGSRFATSVGTNQYVYDPRILLWDAAGCRVTGVIPTPMTNTQLFAYAPDGSAVAAAYHMGSFPAVAAVWDTRSGKKVLAGSVFDGWIIDIAYAQDGKYLLIAGAHSDPFEPPYQKPTVGVWDLSSGKLVNRLPIGNFRRARMAISPDNKLLAVPGHEIHIYAIEYADKAR